MAGAGGQEVGRVNIRVVPNTDRFHEELRAELAREQKPVEIAVDADTTKFKESVRLAREAVEANAATVTVNFDPDIASLQAALAAANFESVDIAMSINLQGAPLVLAELQAIDLIVDRLDGRNIRMTIDVDGLAGAIAQLGALNGIADGTNRLGGSLNAANTAGQSLGRTGLLIVGAFGALLALSGPLVAAGAAVTAAWGAAATAITAIGPLAFGLAGIIAPIALGMDGIKKGFEALTPTIDKLKQRLSDTFEKGIADSIPGLRAIILELDDDLIHIAESLTTALLIFTNIAGLEPNLRTLEGVFSHLQTAIVNIADPLSRIFFTLAGVADRFAAFNLIVDPVTTFANEFESSVTRLGYQSNVLDTAMFGLTGTLNALARGFVYLVENGLTLFSQAAPGVNQFLDSLTNFFNRFDWERLGVAVGNVFSGMAETLDQVPPETIENITAAFERLGDTFKDPKVQQGFATLIDWIPGFIDGINQLIKTFSDLILKVDEVGPALAEFIADMNLLADALGTTIPDKVKAGFAVFDQSIDEAVRKGLGLTPEEYGAKIGDPLYAGIFRAADRANEAAEPAFVKVNDKLYDITTGQEVTVTQGMDGVAAAAAAGATKVADAMVPPQPNFIQGLASVFGSGGAVIDQQTGALAGNASAGATGINNAFQLGIQPLPADAQSNLTPLGTAADPGMSTLNGNLGTAWATAADTTRTGATNVGTEAGQTQPNIESNTSGINASLLLGAGRALMDGLLAGIKAAATAVYNYVSSIAGRIAALKGPLPKDRRLLIPAGLAIMGGLESGLRTGFSGVENFVSSVAPGISGQVTSEVDDIFSRLAPTFKPENTFTSDLSAQYTAAVQGEGVGSQITAALAGWNVVLDADGIARLVNKSNTRRVAR